MPLSTRTSVLLAAALLGTALLGCGDGDEPAGREELGKDDAPATGLDDDDDDEDGEGDETDDDAPRADAGGRPGRPGVFDAGTSPVGSGAVRDGGSTRQDASQPGKDAGASDAGTATSPPATGSDVPAGDHCASVAGWEESAAKFEEEVLTLTNEARAKGFDCDAEGNFGPTTPLKMESRLRCSSRLHSKYMAETGTFDHTQANGSTPFDRMKAAGYTFNAAGENIAAGQRTPKEVVDGWLKSDGHCANIMNPSFAELGVGYIMVTSGPGAKFRTFWTQNFGRTGR
jgi:uncharacterized protein YkwD